VLVLFKVQLLTATMEIICAWQAFAKVACSWPQSTTEVGKQTEKAVK
jgi:hypothetical protein